MRNKTLQICSLLILSITFGVVSAQAQIVSQYKVQIPFDFKIGQKTYQAGEYLINMSNQSRLTPLRSLADDKNHNLKIMPVLMNGQCSQN